MSLACSIHCRAGTAALLTALATTGIAAETCEPAAATVDGAPAIRMSHLGFEPDASKTAILRTGHSEPVTWSVVAPDGSTVLHGESLVFGADDSSGDRVHRIDFGALDTAGQGYVLEACGTTGRPFEVVDNPYAQLSVDTLTYFYLNRLGTPIEAEHAPGPQWARAAGFENSELTCFHGEDRLGNHWPGCGYTRDVTGGWADAGDYGQYVVNGGISVWTLQNFVERLDRLGGPDALGWGDGRAPLPENGNGITDILDEARWHLEWMLAMQVPEGAEVAVAKGRQSDEAALDITVIDGSGLAHHKMHERAWLPLPILPSDADEPRFLQPPSTAATLNLTAAAAQCARVWRSRDDDFAARCLDAAERAYDAAHSHPDIFAYNNFDGGGSYGDNDLADEFDWAAAELFLTTGEERYLDDLARDADQPEQAPAFTAEHADIAWPSVGLLPALSIATLGPDTVPSGLGIAARNTVLAAADKYLSDREREGYAFPFERSQYVWGSNGNLANRGIVLATAYDLTGEARYRNAVVDAMDYLLGRNALDQSYIAGYGERSMRYPHHRFWGAGADPEYPEAPPGAVSGGANASNMADPVAREMRGTCEPQACWADDYRAYALNEVAINWNAPVFWIAAFLDTTATGRASAID